MNASEKKILDRLNSPGDLAGLEISELEELAGEIRELIIDVVSRNGGHLAPSLGVVELTLALLRVFDPGSDRIIWDVGHQAYAYKILTGRRQEFFTLRQLDGISGFPRRSESRFDTFGVGHSSTSISAGLGMAVARDILGKDNKVVAVIGDGSMTAGLAYEGLNQAGDLDRDLVVVLNDNEMSISKNVGALSSYLSRKLSSRWVVRLKKDIESWMRQIPRIGNELAEYARRSEESLKSFFTPGMLFEAFKFNYLGPIDGHNIKSLVDVFHQVRDLQGPVLVHVTTKKGKGYPPAEENPTYFHGVGGFEPETGVSKKVSAAGIPSYTAVFGDYLCELAEKDERIVAITAAMPEGTGLSNFEDKFPERFFDVGICEQHAVTFAAGLATQGFRPVLAIYSTFLQRSYDQVVHDVCLQNLPVTFCLDRGGLVGEDGPTHHGVFDLSFLRHIPNMTLMAPKDEFELKRLMLTAVNLPGPGAVRYPRGVGPGADLTDRVEPIPLGEGEFLSSGGDAAVIALGSRVYPALEAAQELQEAGVRITVFNARFVKPLPEKQLVDIFSAHENVVLVEENSRQGGFSSAVLELVCDSGAFSGQRIKRVGIGDSFVEHGKQKELRRKYKLGSQGIKESVLSLVDRS
ncbi:MAG: 1-deoxy-D-xylulose-5-phosphate synthase [Desulfonatronovibrionaceae bacterium]